MDSYKLNLAKQYYESCQFMKAYHILRRFFDRLPFSFEEKHAEYLAIYIRILHELNKIKELYFYIPILEKKLEKSFEPAISYSLGAIYINLLDSSLSYKAKKLFEKTINYPHAGIYADKAKLGLAYYYDKFLNDISKCRKIIFSMREPEEKSLKKLLIIWKAKIMRSEGNLDKALELLSEILNDSKCDWYSYFCAKIGIAYCLIKKKEYSKAHMILNELKNFYLKRTFKTLKTQLLALEEEMENFIETNKEHENEKIEITL